MKNIDLNFKKVSLAPMAGITDCVLRNLVREYSHSCLLTTEMISSEGLKNVHDCNIIKKSPTDSPIAYQISGHKPELMAQAAKFLENRADIIDINMGCPVKKVVCGNDGSALMKTPELAQDIVKAVDEAVNIPVSVKFRLGYTADSMNYVEFGQMMQEAGAKMITIHARTKAQMYSGKADWIKIKDLKHAVDIPVFANGDVVSIETAEQCLEQSQADGIAIGRGVLGDVTLPYRIEHFFETGERLPEPTIVDKLDMLTRHLEAEISMRGLDVGIKCIRKLYGYYISGIKNAAKYRATLVQIDDYGEMIKTIEQIRMESCLVH
ncbi:tRNA dihydrouridine synthase DusB [bacterium]|nr:tRNA dihydrouridine synthase DusB [bacterium]